MLNPAHKSSLQQDCKGLVGVPAPRGSRLGSTVNRHYIGTAGHDVQVAEVLLAHLQSKRRSY